MAHGDSIHWKLEGSVMTSVNRAMSATIMNGM